MINEKKSRFLKTVEEESNHNISFRLSFVHFDEIQNDNVRFRGSYRQNIYALKSLDKYGFTNIINISNYYKENDNTLIKEFEFILQDLGIENSIIQVSKWCDGTEITEKDILNGELDCMTSRTLTSRGIFACPFLANDYRGRCGMDFGNYSNTIRLETPYCATCIRNKEKIFSIEITEPSLEIS
jgi:hypothetical protein